MLKQAILGKVIAHHYAIELGQNLLLRKIQLKYNVGVCVPEDWMQFR